MNIRLLISDIDGTLVRNDKTLSEGVVAAVLRAKAAGLHFSLISARPPSGMLWIAQKLGLTGPIGAFNGGTLVDGDGAILSAEYLDPAIARHVFQLIDAPGVTPWLFADGRWYVQTTEGKHVARERLASNQEPVICATFEGLAERADKIVAVSEDYEALAGLESAVGQTLGSFANVVRSQPYFLDFTAPAANKGTGVIALAQAYNVPLHQVAVMGDQNNDLAMFKVVGYSVAMGQAPQNVRQAACAVASSNEDDGVADAIDRLILPNLRLP